MYGSLKFILLILFNNSIIKSKGANKKPSLSLNQSRIELKYSSKKPSSGTNKDFKPLIIRSTNFLPKKLSEKGFKKLNISPIFSNIFLFVSVFSLIALVCSSIFS